MTAAVRSDGVTSPRPQLWRISDRTTFQALRSARRVRRGPISVTYLAPAAPTRPAPPRVAFAVAKSAGGAVARNRIRRRLRAALHELQGRDALPAGAYLVGAGAELVRLPWSALVLDLEQAVAAAAEVSS